MLHAQEKYAAAPRRNTSIYENIQYLTKSYAKVTVTSIRSSAYHWHYDYEFIAVLKGRIEILYSLYDVAEQKLSAGDVLLVNSKGIHGVRGIDPENICVCIQFSPELFEPVPAGMKYRFFLNSASREYGKSFSRKHFMELAARVCIASRKKSADANLRKNAWLNMMLADFLGGGVQYELLSAPTNTEKEAELAMVISSFVDENLSEENLPDLVYREFGLSEKGMYRLLKEVIGVTLKEMIDTSRVERACMLLRDSSIPLQMISDQCGYSGETTFYRRFKSALGITPGQYRAGVKVNSVSNDVQDYLSIDESEVDILLQYWAGLEE